MGSIGAPTPKPGTIDFGTGYNSKFEVVNETTTFAKGQHVAWVAHLRSDVGHRSLVRVIDRIGAGSANEVVSRRVTVKDSSYNTLAIQLSPDQLEAQNVKAPGTYRVRYLAGSTELAQGQFHRSSARS